MIRRFAVASLLTLASAAGLSSAASAQAVNGNVSYDALVAKKCVVSSSIPVTTLTQNGTPFATSLSGSVNLSAQCNSNAGISSSVIRTDTGAVLTQPATSTHGVSLYTYVPALNGAFTIALAIDAQNSGNILPAATYAYTATATVTPQ